jgi:Tol biopolymer transport system component
MRSTKTVRLLAGGISVLVLTTAVSVAAKEFGPWSPPVSAESLPGSSPDVNTSSNDGCPIISPDGQWLYMASNRPGGQGGLDIWRAPRSGDGWGAPENLGPTVNTAADEFCPDPARGNRLFFVRRLSATNTDIFMTRTLPTGFTTPERLPVGDDGINSPWEEWSPSYFETEDGRQMLYFSSTRNGHPAQDIFYSVNFGSAQFAAGGVNSSASDARPNVRHDGLEIVWDSTRTGSLGGPDIWTASRSSVDEPWGTAVHLENGINSPANETRASMSWDGETLVFGSTRPGEGSADIYVSTREKVTGKR